MISVQNLSKHYGATRAVDQVNFDIDRGEIVGLLGRNGAGKTTTMRILTAYLAPTSGSARINDLDVLEHPVAVRRLIGYLPEFAPLYQDMLPHDYLRHVIKIRGLRKDIGKHRLEELTDLCGLREVMHQPFRELSRGYKQRVGLAHAMIGDPEILILDEPTSGLDPNQIVEIRSLIREAGTKKTVIFSTHILSEAESTCDRIIIIDQGKIVADDTTGKLKADARGNFVIRCTLLGATVREITSHLKPLPDVKRVGRAADSPGTSPPQPATPQRDPIDIRIVCRGDAREAIYAKIKEKSWILLEFGREEHSLEETFRDLTVGDAATRDSGRAPASRGRDETP